MSKKLKKMNRFLIPGLVACAAFLGGCADDGSVGLQGPQGEQGEAGIQGEAGAVTHTEESCAVCHGAGKAFDVADQHDVEAYTANNQFTVTDVAFNGAGDGTSGMTISFTMTDEAGNGLDLLDPQAFLDRNGNAFVEGNIIKVNLSKLVQDASGAAVYNWQNYMNTEKAGAAITGVAGTPVLATAIQATGTDCATTQVDAAAGTYTCTIDTDLTNVTTPLAVTWEPTLTHRLALYFGGHLEEGQPANGWADFIPATIIGGGTLAAAEAAVVNTRDIATTASCNECHGSLHGHGGDRVTVEICVTCHNPGTTDPESGLGVDMSTMIHKIHYGDELTGEYTIYGYGGSVHDFTEVAYPENIMNCDKCHTGADAATADGDNWQNNPNIAACGSCHEVTFTGEATHTGNVQTNDGCATCHPATGTGYGKSVATAHATTLTGNEAAEYTPTITIEAPDNGTYYVAGEAPLVTVTLAAADGGAAVDYTAAKDAKGDRDGALSGANLYVYGPRAKAVPVLTTGSSTDPALEAGATPTQGHALFTGGSDAQVQTDAAGFKYQLLAIPEGMTAGTYMVRFEGADYGGVDPDDWVTSSSAVLNIQIGTATEEAKVAGDCTTCHGATRMHLTGSHAHNAAFDTDHCLACHDQSGNYGVVIANRVHAVHAASDSDHGDLGSNRDFAEVTYPQEIDHCATCHSSTATTFMTAPAGAPCLGCHGETVGIRDHMEQNGATFGAH